MMDFMQKRPLLMAAFLAGLLALFAAGGVISRGVGILSMDREIKSCRQEATKLVRDLRSGRLRAEEYSQLSAALSRAPGTEESKGMPLLIDRIVGISERQGAAVESLRPGHAVTADGVERLPLQVDLRCNLGSLTGILYAIDRSRPLLVVDSLEVRQTEKKDGGGGAAPLQVEMTVSSLALKNMAPAERREDK